MGVLSRYWKGEPSPDPDGPYRGSREEYIESIRWKGEIYCRACRAELKRVPISDKWYEAATYDPFDGHELSFVEQHGPTGLMVCSQYEVARLKSMSIYGPPSPQRMFEKMEISRHGLYYVDTPPL